MAIDGDQSSSLLTSQIFRPRGGVEQHIGYWQQLLEELQASPQGFYAAVDAAIQRRAIPDCRLSRVDWHEGGLVSAKREYLRAERGDILIDICGAPFGNAFFVSSWLCAPPPSILKAVGLAFGLLAFLGLCTQMNPGLLASLLWWGTILAFLAVVAFGIIWPFFFPPRLTYYRVDTAQMFYQAVHRAVLEVIDGLSSEQGLRLLSESERKPIMPGFGR